MKELFRKFIPPVLLKAVRPSYHGFLAWCASWFYGRPANQLIVVGVTGTAGKSTTAAMLSHILNSAGKKCGYITTVNFFDGKRDYINKHGLSMPGGPLLQKSLRQMISKGCNYAVIECTSEGLSQNRHLGINFDVALFTNLSEAHIDTHGSYEKYRQAKEKLFSGLSNHSVTNNKLRIDSSIKKSIGVNSDDQNAHYFLEFSAGQKFGVTLQQITLDKIYKLYSAKKLDRGFYLQDVEFEIKLVGEFNLYNALLAAACANILGVEIKQAAEAMSKFTGIRGRMEPVSNNRGIQIFVDYGCEPATIRAALLAANGIPHHRIIHVFGTTGGHRDVSKRFDFGRASAELADESIITNDDVYDSDPNEIAKNSESGIRNTELRRHGHHYEIILDRREAIKKALDIAQPNDLVLITGKGSEQFLVMPGNKRIPWDEVSVVKELL